MFPRLNTSGAYVVGTELDAAAVTPNLILRGSLLEDRLPAKQSKGM